MDTEIASPEQRRAALVHLQELRGTASVDFERGDRDFLSFSRTYNGGIITPERLVERVRRWWTGDGRHPRQTLQDSTWIDAALHVDEHTQYEGSLTAPHLYVVSVRDRALLPLLDYRTTCLIKTQPLHTEHVVSFTWDTLIGWLLRKLTIDYTLMVTPHFATVLDALFCRVEGDAPALVCVQERGMTELIDYIDRERTDTPHVRALLWAVLFSLHAANKLLGFAHGDCHMGNVMVRDVTGTPYENRTWAYRLREDPNVVYVVPPEQHRNMLVEIIDFGHSSVRPLHSRYAADSAETSRFDFWSDAGRLFTYMPMTAVGSGVIAWLKHFVVSPTELTDDIQMLLDEQPDAWWSTSLFVGHIQRHDTTAVMNAPRLPLLIAHMPDANAPTRKRRGDAAGGDPKRQRVRPLECHVCACPARYVEETKRGRGFCSHVCQLIAHGFLQVHE